VGLRVLLVAAVTVLAVPSAAAARPVKAHHHSHASAPRIVGTWDTDVTPDGAPPFKALLTLTRGGGVIETESNAPGTGQGSWKRIGPDRFAVAFQTFIFSPTGDPAGRAVVRSVVTATATTLSGPYKFDVFDPAGNKVQSGSGTATATPFVIPAF
jgi:hypothetical protein